jgi:hypothetical protein
MSHRSGKHYRSPIADDRGPPKPVRPSAITPFGSRLLNQTSRFLCKRIIRMAKDEQFERLGRSTLAGELKLLLDGDAGIARGRRRSGRPVWDCIRNNGFLHRKSLSKSVCQAEIGSEQDRSHRRHHTRCGAPSSTFCRRLPRRQRSAMRHGATPTISRALRHGDFTTFQREKLQELTNSKEFGQKVGRDQAIRLECPLIPRALGNGESGRGRREWPLWSA